MRIDLHTHTTASDGKLTALEVMEAAAALGVNLLSITDHDTTAAYEELTALDCGPTRLVPGVEFSTRWRKIGIHVLGLNVQLNNAATREAIAFQNRARTDRAEHIARALEKLGIGNPLADVVKIAGRGTVGRPHFAQHLVNVGVVPNIRQAFQKYLGAGKPGDIKQHWAPLSQIVEWIRGAGGTAVLAHPQKYKLTDTGLRALIDDFAAAGGQGIEVISGTQNPSVTGRLADLCEHMHLVASCGSDFHEPGQDWARLGHCAALPDSCVPVWDRW